MDRWVLAHPNPGSRPFQRLSRAEYARSIHELLDIDVDVSALLPPDTFSAGFDNIADAQSFSPTVMEGYIRAAARIATEALGDPSATRDVDHLHRALHDVADAAGRWRARRAPAAASPSSTTCRRTVITCSTSACRPPPTAG